MSTIVEPNTVSDGLPPRREPPKKSGRWWKIPLALAVPAALALTGAAVWLAATESGLRFGLYRLPQIAGVQIQSETLSGTLWDGFDGRNWTVKTPTADVEISRIGLQWQPGALRNRLLHINRITLGDIHIAATRPSPPEEKPPAALPQSIDLPLAVQIDSLAVGRITSGSKDNVLVSVAEAAYRYDRTDHRLTVDALQTPWSTNRGEIVLNTASPFALNGKITGDGVLSDTPVKGEAGLSGSLERAVLAADLAGGNIKLNVAAEVSPFAEAVADKVASAKITGRNLNPADFLPDLPQADLDFDASLMPSEKQGMALEGLIELENRAAAPADRQAIPVRRLSGRFGLDEAGVLAFRDTELRLLGKGRISLSGQTDTAAQTLSLDTGLSDVSAADVIGRQFDDTLNGKLQLRGTYSEPQLLWLLDSRRAEIGGEALVATDTANGQRTVRLASAHIRPQNGGEMTLAGELELFNRRALKLDIVSRQFNPAKLYPDFPLGNVNGEIALNGELADLTLSGKMKFAESTLSGVPLRGSADVLYEKQHLARAVSDILLGRNQIRTGGSFGKSGDKLNIHIAAPELDKFGFGLGGSLNAQGYLAGEPDKLDANLTGSVRNLRAGSSVQVQQLDFNLIGSPDYSRPLHIRAEGRSIILPGEGSPTRIDQLDADIRGTGLRHTIRVQGNMQAGGKPYRLNAAAEGGLERQNNHWKGTVRTLDMGGAFNLTLQNPMQLEAGARRVAMSASRWAAMGGSLNLERFAWDAKDGLSTKGSANNLHMAQLHNFYEPPVKHDLVLAGDWDLSYSSNMRGYANIRRQSGDIVFSERNQSLGLADLTLNTRFQNGGIEGRLNGTTRYGSIDGNVLIHQQFGGDIARAPVSGNIRLNAPDLAAFRSFMPIGQTLRGRLQGSAAISGRVGDPQFNGTLNGDNLYYTNRELGLILDNGSLRSRLAGRRWIIDALRFQRGGTVTLSGDVNLAGSRPDVNVAALFDRYEALDRPDRKLTLSGDAKLIYTEKTGVALTGSLKADEGRFGFQRSGMPALGDDVVVLGEPPKEKSAPTPISLNLVLDLNDRFYFSGEGLDVALGGRLTLTARPGEDVQGVGTVNIVKGRYKAYGQDLNIEKGTISFVGPLNNPNLNIRATRNLSPVGAGVEVLGNLENPRITLVANEPMSEKDKLSWLILNRASSGSDGDEAALAAAAGAWLAGSINDRIGLVDNFGFTSQRTRNAQTGELNPAEQVLTVGKQLTGELYLGYEYGINSASQSVKLIYQLTRSIQAIARVGSESWGGELKYVIRFD
ncbi:translocation/assembly module TamB domain-containing protein [Neisseria leonii]|uniref:Translocation/assembly module TamB n=1 Tax=Neisseria leonii TaxID=2995413 RepID=A0A9X4E5I6_9NEIS|nr:translocation/assembly module TamB domain-containing protein [Neisseria sp. 51.81]MDD9327827.1 translocation/assembly module TamB [Neisseria sp. 51.81]